MSDNVPAKNKRAFQRRPAKGKVKVTCRKGSMDMGANLATGLLDVSESGIRLMVKTSLPVGQEVSVGLEGPLHMRPVVRQGKVMWCVQSTDGDHCVGIQLEKYLAYEDIRRLT